MDDSDSDLNVKHGANISASPLSVFLELTDLADHHLLLHPACSDLFAFSIFMPTSRLALLLLLSCQSNLMSAVVSA